MSLPPANPDADFHRAAAAGDALVALLAAHRPYLRHVAGVRFDDRLRGRLDESDLVQDALADAVRAAAAFAATRRPDRAASAECGPGGRRSGRGG